MSTVAHLPSAQRVSSKWTSSGENGIRFGGMIFLYSETVLLAVSITESIYLTFYKKTATLLDKCMLLFSEL